jgi:ribulose-5-phosphate 4-epimerase/fuculose-1-phosphate aldolase
VLYNHGLMTLGETIHGTLARLYGMERACEVELMARQMNTPVVPISDYVIGKAAERMKKLRASPEYGLLAWEALVRTMDAKGFNYRT